MKFELKIDDRVLTCDNLNGRIKEISSPDVIGEPMIYTVLLEGNMGSKQYTASQLVLKETSSEMAQSEKVAYFKTSLGLVGIHTDERTCALLIATYECFLKLGGKFSVHDAVAIQVKNEQDYAPKDSEK